MSYDPTVWKSGDTITSAKLNKLEQGVADASGGGTGGGAFKVGITFGDVAVMDKTWAEINEAFDNGIVFSTDSPTGGKSLWIISTVGHSESYDVVACFLPGLSMEMTFTTDSENGYPSATEG